MHGDCSPAGSRVPTDRRPRIEVADIVRAHGDALRRDPALSPRKRAALRAIETCRTATLGGHVDVCGACGHEVPSYNSCRDRHCPKCQALAQAQWIEDRKHRILPVHHFHLVFTLPHELNDLVLRHPDTMYDLLFAAASGALLTVAADPRHLGAVPGVTMVLHTWTRDLRLHPHVHVIVTGGGLAAGDERWIATRPGFLFPKRVLGRVFRGRFLQALRKARTRGDLGPPDGRTDEDPSAFPGLLGRLYAKDWLVFAKATFGCAAHVFEYLGRYTHRTGISNQRLLSFDEHAVRFRTRGDRETSLPPQEFLRRFLLHVLPRGYVKIRHYGLLASGNVRTRLAVARALLAAIPSAPPPPPKRTWRDRLLSLTGQDVSLCPRCRAPMTRVPLDRPWLALPAYEDSS